MSGSLGGLTPIEILDEGAALDPGQSFDITLHSPEAAAIFRYDMYNLRRAARRKSKETYDPFDDGYNTSPWEEVSIYKGALPGVLVVKRKAPLLASMKENK